MFWVQFWDQMSAVIWPLWSRRWFRWLFYFVMLVIFTKLFNEIAKAIYG